MTKKNKKWFFSGILYIGLGCFSLIWLREDDYIGKNTTFWLFFCIWAMDIGAYFFGRTIGGPKLAPRLSPHKTWAGANPWGAAGAKTTEMDAMDAAKTAIFGEEPDPYTGVGIVATQPTEEEGIAYTLAEQEYKQAAQAQMSSLGYDVNLLDMQQLLGVQDGLWGGGTFNYQAELARV